MNRKLILVTTMLALILHLDFNAATVYTSDGSELDSNAAICAYDDYYYNTRSEGMFEAEIVDSSNRMLVSTTNAQNGELKFTFPANVPNLTVYVYSYVDSSQQLIEKFEFVVTDCGYEATVDDYQSAAPQTTFSKYEFGLTFTEPALENYKLYINQVEEDDDGKSIEIKFNEGLADVEIEADVIQLIEEYTDSEGKKQTKYFEIYREPDIVVRSLTNLDLNVIAPLDYLDKKILMRVLVGLITLIVLYLTHMITVKKYRAKREYNRKLKAYKEKRRAQLIKERKIQELERLKNLERIRQAEREREKRSNLEIRK